MSSSPLVTGVDFVAVPTDDFDTSTAFYGETLGLPLIARYGEMPGAEFQAGNLTLAVMEATAFGQEFRPNCMPIALQVDGDYIGSVTRARFDLAAGALTVVS